MNNIEFLIFNLLFFFLGRSIIQVFYKNKLSDESKIFGTSIFIFYPIFGLIAVSSISFLLNFFVKLENSRYLILFVFIILIIIKNRNFRFSENKLFLIFNYIVIPLILAFSSYDIKLHYDAESYHLNSQSWILNSKIVFGLANYYIWAGHSSLYEYTQSFFHGENFIYLHYLNLVFFSFFINFLNYHLIRKKNNFFYNLSFILLIFGILDNFGIGGGSNGFIQIQMAGKPDVGVGILFFVISMMMIYGLYEEKSNKNEIQILFILLTFAIQLRILSVSLIFFLIPYLLKNKYLFYKVVKSKYSIFLIFYNFLWLLKNVIVSSCLFFPLKFTCFSRLNWNIDSEIISISNYYSNWPLAYKFNSSFIAFIETWFTRGHISQQVPNLFLSIFLIGVLRYMVFNKTGERYFLVYLINFFVFITLLTTTFNIRYSFGFILVLVGTLSFNLIWKNEYKFLNNKYLIYSMFLILSVGIPRGYSYSYFIQNPSYYELNIDKTQIDVTENIDGYGVKSNNNKCFNIYQCSTFQFSDNEKVKPKKNILNYKIFTD